jgi:hypothetical protein
MNSNEHPKGFQTTGHLLGGPLFFEMDLLQDDRPFSLWRLVDGVNSIQELMETLEDKDTFRRKSVFFSGHRGFHVLAEPTRDIEEPILFSQTYSNNALRDYRKERLQIARSIGFWFPEWDWRVSSDIWRISRVPWSMHAKSALRAISLTPPYTANRIRDQLRVASPFSFDRKVRIRIKQSIPIFTFIDGVSYGPYRKGWVTRIPLAVALHLVWQDLAKLREQGPKNVATWFERGWRKLFRESVLRKPMYLHERGGITS